MKQIRFDNTQAMTEGWFISEVGAVNDEWRLERDDEAGVFKSDSAAWEHVVKRADKGSVYHIRALKFLECNAPEEFERIENHSAAVMIRHQVSDLFANLVKEDEFGTFKITAWSNEMKRRVLVFTYHGLARLGIQSAEQRADQFGVTGDFRDYQAERLGAVGEAA